jgi:putative Ca2+/H+ antiporter (TMEM165/GDT1 family)
MLIALAIGQAIFAIGALPVINGHIRDRHVNAAWGAIGACVLFVVTAYALIMEAMQ